MSKNTARKCWNLISGVVLLLLLAAESLLLYRIWSLNMLPQMYFMILAGAMLLATGLISLLLFQGRKSKKKGHGKRIIGYLLVALIVGLCMYAQNAVNQVLGTINAITVPNKVNVVLEIYVRADETVDSFRGVEDCVLAFPEDMAPEAVNQISGQLEDMLGCSVTPKLYPHITKQVDALFSGEADVAVLDSAYLSILETMEAYADFDQKARLLQDQVIEKEVPTEPDAAETEPPREFDVTQDSFLVYISGSDSRYTMLSSGRSDVNILVAVNPQDHQILLINTPRDCYVVNPAGGEEAWDKLTHCSVRGVENSVVALENLYGVDIDYYARINFSGLETLIDAIGGVTIYSDKAFNAVGVVYINKGENHLNGAQALAFARERKRLQGGDRDRGKNQMKLIEGIVNELSAGNLLENYTDILESLKGMFATDLPADKIGQLVQFQISQMPKWEMLSVSLTGDNGTDHCWASGDYAYVMYPHAHSVEHVRSLIEAVLAGEALSEEDLIVNPWQKAPRWGAFFH